MKFKRALIIGSWGSGNIGDEAARITLQQLLSKAGYQTYAAHWGGIGVDLYMAENSVPFELAFKTVQDVQMANETFDMVIISGGGIIGNKFALTKCGNLGMFLDNFKNPIYCISIGVDHNSNYDKKDIANKLITRADFFSVRDNMDKRVLEQITNHQIKVTPDIVFAYENAIPGPVRVCMNKDVILTYAAANADLDALAEKYAKIVNDIEAAGYSVTVLPFTPTVCDLTFMVALKEHLNRPQVIELHTLPYIYEAIAGAKLVIGGRLHACVLAELLGKKFVAINYHPKVGAFCDQVNCKDYWPQSGILELDKVGYGIAATELITGPIIGRALELLTENSPDKLGRRSEVEHPKTKQLIELFYSIIAKLKQ